jgi:hypothetical protein
MAATKEQQRRYQAALRRVLARFREAEPERYKRWLAEELAAWDQEQLGPEAHPRGGRLVTRLARRDEPHDIRRGDKVVHNGGWETWGRGPVLPGEVVDLDHTYVWLLKPNNKRVRVLRSSVWVDGKERRTGYSVIEDES